MHAPHDVEAFWAAATAEGGVSPDPGDIVPGSPTSDAIPDSASAGVLEESRSTGSAPSLKGESVAEELVRVLGLSPLDARDDELDQDKGRER